MLSEQILNDILEQVSDLDFLKLTEERKNQFSEFIISSVNGDNVSNYLVVDANLDDKNKGAIAYILTDNRFIKVHISLNEMGSFAYPLDTMVGLQRKLLINNRSEIAISFQNGFFGLRYPSDDKKVSNFFQQIDVLSAHHSHSTHSPTMMRYCNG